MPLFILPITPIEETGASYADFDIDALYEASVDELGDGVREFDVDTFNDDFHGELYFMDTLKNCRVCDGEIYANKSHAICDCDLPF